MAGKQPRLTTDATTPEHPDTVADKVEPLNPADVNPDDLDPSTYGFNALDTEGVKEAYREGPGFLEPTRVEPLSSVQNSTFAERAAARNKQVTGQTDTVTAK